MYDYALQKTVEQIFFKLAAKNREQLERIHNKIKEARSYKTGKPESGVCRDEVAIG